MAEFEYVSDKRILEVGLRFKNSDQAWIPESILRGQCKKKEAKKWNLNLNQGRSAKRQMCTPMLVQASQVYTPVIFRAFQSEYEKSMVACARVLVGDNKYGIAIGRLHGDLSFEEERIVIGDPLNRKAAKQQNKNDDVQPQVEVEGGGANLEHPEYNVIASFTQFLTAPN